MTCSHYCWKSFQIRRRTFYIIRIIWVAMRRWSSSTGSKVKCLSPPYQLSWSRTARLWPVNWSRSFLTSDTTTWWQSVFCFISKRAPNSNALSWNSLAWVSTSTCKTPPPTSKCTHSTTPNCGSTRWNKSSSNPQTKNQIKTSKLPASTL